MPRDEEPAIEVEILEIDGAAPPPPRNPATGLTGMHGDAHESSPSHPSANWQGWPGQIRTLPAWCWPLLIVAGALLLGLVLVLGVLAAVVVLIYRIIRGLLRALFE